MKTVNYSLMFDHVYGTCLLGAFVKYRICGDQERRVSENVQHLF